MSTEDSYVRLANEDKQIGVSYVKFHLETDVRDRGPVCEGVVNVFEIQGRHSMQIDSWNVVLDEKIKRSEYSSQIELRDLHGRESAFQIARNVDMDRR